MSIHVDEHGKATVDTVAEAFEVCDAPNVQDIVIRDPHERIKLEKILRGFNLAPVRR